ncbi:hypothetical protein BG000_006751 [Podila horticola]|nr:hypothetical protein BG000_006751 [Podila horticola]
MLPYCNMNDTAASPERYPSAHHPHYSDSPDYRRRLGSTSATSSSMSANNSFPNRPHELPGKSVDMVVSDTTPSSPARHSSYELGRSKTMPGDLSQYRKLADPRLSQFAMHGQGVNVSDMDSVFQCINRQVDITTVDLSQTQYETPGCLNNNQILQWLSQPRPDWSKVRWININGMSWDVIKAIAIEYNLHHLAVEDLLHIPQRTKVDVYPQQTFISCTLLTLMETLGDGTIRQIVPMDSPHGIDPNYLSQRLPLEELDNYKQYNATNYTSQDTLNVQMEQVAIFLLKDGTLITFFQVSGQSVVAPIIERLSHDYSITRKHEDVTFLLQSLIDAIVDHAIPITAAFRYEINDLELHVLAMPRMKYTRDLHRLTAQLSMLKRTLAPTQMLVHSLRGKTEKSPLSSLARTYMGDVMDHCNTMVEDIDSMLGLCEKLINMVSECVYVGR